MSVAAVAAVLVAACAGDPSLDIQSIVDGVPAAVVPDAPEVVTGVECPELEESPIAQQLSCRAVINGEEIVIDLEVDEDGVVVAAARDRLLDLGEVEVAASERLGADLGADVTIRCPGTVVVVRPGVTVACTGSSAGRERDLVVEIVDATGGWEISIAESSPGGVGEGR